MDKKISHGYSKAIADVLEIIEVMRHPDPGDGQWFDLDSDDLSTAIKDKQKEVIGE